MNIKECKKQLVFPKWGTPVKTRPYKGVEPGGFLVSKDLIDNRKKATGKYIGFAAGAGGDVWYVVHDDGSIAAYSTIEVFDQ